MSGSEPKTEPDYYERPLSEESKTARVLLEKDLADLDEQMEHVSGIARLKLQKRRERIQLSLDWQGANPKELDFEELREVVQEPLHEDTVEDTYRAKIKSPKTAIRAYCISCQGGSIVGVRECPAVTCPLWPFRMGRDPLRGYDLPKADDPELSEIELLEDEDIPNEEGDDEDED